MQVKLVELNLWLVLGALIWIAAWLVPNHLAPWPAFYSELLAAVGLLPLAVWVCTRFEPQHQLPVEAKFVAVVALIPAIQAAAGQIRFAGDAALATLYLMAAALSIAVGARWWRLASQRASVCLALTALSAALLTVMFAAMQWLHIESLGVLLAALPAKSRPSGNIAQANHFSTLCAWGLISIWLLYEQRHMRRGIAAAAAAMLIFGVALSQSRTGWLQVALLALCGVLLRHHFNFKISPMACAALVALLLALVAGWDRLNEALGLVPAMALEQRSAAGPRGKIWSQLLAALGQSPWFGYGWTQVGLAQQAVVTQTPALHYVVSYAHNLPLDLLLWNGIPLGSLLIGLMGIWTLRFARRLSGSEQALCALAIFVVGVHAMLELPHAYAYFLLPCALIVGMLSAAQQKLPKNNTQIPRAAGPVVVAVAAIATVWLVVDYHRAEVSLMEYRFEAARVGTARGSVAPNLHALPQLAALLHFVRQPVDAVHNDIELQDAARVVGRFPSAANQFRLALSFAHAGRPNAAAETLAALCQMQTLELCANARSAWNVLQRETGALRAVVLPAPIEASPSAP